MEASIQLDARQSAEANLYASLVRAAQAISALGHEHEVVRNIGRQNMHHSGFMMLVSRSLGLLAKVKGRAKVHLI